MRKTARTMTRAGMAVGAASLAAVALAPTAAMADHANGTYQTTLNQVNESGGSGMAMITIDDTTATVELSFSGLTETFMDGPYPHVQHVHIGGQGVCPTPDADENGDGVVSTPEGIPAYGQVGTTLTLEGGTGADQATNIEQAPGGGSATYSRTFEMNSDTLDALADGTGVVVVHGLNPEDLSEEAANADSELEPSLPLAATAPALCGALSTTPAGGADTGSGNSAGIEQAGLLGTGGALAVAAAAVAGLAVRRRAGDEA